MGQDLENARHADLFAVARVYPLGESNPCLLAENQVSWATRRRGPGPFPGRPYLPNPRDSVNNEPQAAERVNWEYLHLVSHPFAIVLPIVGAIVGLAGWAVRREELERYGVLSILLGGTAAIPSYFTGIAAADDVSQRVFVTPSVVQNHRTWATWAAVLLVTAAIFAAYSLLQPRERRLRRFVLLTGAAAALLTSLAALRGGKIEHADGGAPTADTADTSAPTNPNEEDTR